MNDRKKIGVIAGGHQYGDLLSFMRSLSQDYDLHLFAFERPKILDTFNLKCRVFALDYDMPGYMEGLDKDLEEMDMVITFESTNLYSFQVSRLCQSLGIPFVVLSTDWQTFLYRKSKNILAVQFDVLRNADAVIAPSEMCGNFILRNGGAQQKLFVAPFASDLETYSRSREGREKFRKYVGVGQEEILFGMHVPQKGTDDVFLTLGAFAVMKDSHSLKNGVKLIVSGTGASDNDLKYRAQELGLGRHVLFLPQDIGPFAADYFNALDFVINQSKCDSDFASPLPSFLLSAVSCGVLPIVPAASVGESLVGPSGFSFESGSVDSLAQVIWDILHTEIDLEEMRNSQLTEMEKRRQIQGEFFGQLVSELLTERHGKINIADELNRLSDSMGPHHLDWLDELKKIESKVEHKKDRSTYHRLMGEYLLASGDVESSEREFRSSIELDDQNQKGWRGLGYSLCYSQICDESVACFKKSLALDSADASSYLGMGMAYQRAGMFEAAIYWLEQALLLDSESRQAVVALSQACLDLKDVDKAIKVLNHVIKNIGEDPLLLTSLSNLYFRQGMFSEGERVLSEGVAS